MAAPPAVAPAPAAAVESLAKRQDERHKRGRPPQSGTTRRREWANRELGKGTPFSLGSATPAKANGLTDDLANVSLLSLLLKSLNYIENKKQQKNWDKLRQFQAHTRVV